MTTGFRFTASERDIFRKRPPISVSRWGAENIVVPDGPFAGGRLRLDVNPYLAGIMDAWGHPWTEEVDVIGSPQTGKTLLMYICIAYSVDRRPGVRMLAMPDDETLGKVRDGKLKPLFRSCRRTRELQRKATAGKIAFQTGILYLSSAQSPAQRASISVMDLFLDEEDLYRPVAGQGVPVLDFLERTRSYSHKRKIMRVSKPIGDETSSIYQTMARGEDGRYLWADEVRRYEARCPACMKHQILVEAGLVCRESQDPAEIERRRLARYQCAHCGFLWTDHSRDVAVAYGRWAAEESVERPRRIAFHIPAVLSRVVSLSEILAAKLRSEATDSPDAKQAYANGWWAEPYTAAVVEAQESELLELREPDTRAGVVPKGAVALAAGIDMQTRDFWFTVWAFAPNLASWLVDYGRLRTWDDVAAFVFETSYEMEQGGTMPIWRAALDTGGTIPDPNLLSRTEEAYLFLREHAGRGVLFGTKGLSRPRITPVTYTVREKLPRSGKPIPGGVALYLLDPDYFKSLLFGRLKLDARQPARLYELRQDSSGAWVKAGHEELIKHLQAEKLLRGRDGKLRWTEVGRHNHLLDACALAHACADPAWFPSLQFLVQREQPAETAAQTQTQPAPHPSGRVPGWLANRRA